MNFEDFDLSKKFQNLIQLIGFLKVKKVRFIN